MSIKIHAPTFDEEVGEYKVVIQWDSSLEEYFFLEESDADNFYRVQETAIGERNE